MRRRGEDVRGVVVEVADGPFPCVGGVAGAALGRECRRGHDRAGEEECRGQEATHGCHVVMVDVGEVVEGVVVKGVEHGKTVGDTMARVTR